MRKIINHLKVHLREDFNYLVYGLNAAFLAICIPLNYIFDFEDSVIDAYSGREIRILFYFLFYAFAYYYSCFTYALVFRKNIFANREFWVKSLFFLLLISFDAAFYYHRPIIQQNFPIQLHYFLIKVFNNLSGVLIIALPLFVFYKLYEKEKSKFYGFNAESIDLNPYYQILMVMAPLVAFASFDESFMQQYPNFKDNTAASFLGWEKWITVLIFEIAYGSDFVMVELMFRGFIIIGMIKILGRGAIMPMAVTYTFYHFGKPAGEALSSIFGGYILGIIAYNTRSIYGGIVVHLGVAWMMELFAFLQKSFRP